MGNILRRRVRVEDKRKTISIDDETHDAVKYWAHKEGISMGQAAKIMVFTFVRSQLLKEKRGKAPDVRTETFGQLIQAAREAKKKIADRGLIEP